MLNNFADNVSVLNLDREVKYTWESLIPCINKKDYY